MRKECIDCNLICFAHDTTCKRCGSDHLVEVPLPSLQPVRRTSLFHRLPIVWCYLITVIISISLALIIEFIALLPILPLMGWCRSGPYQPTAEELSLEHLSFVLHLPTILVTWG